MLNNATIEKMTKEERALAIYALIERAALLVAHSEDIFPSNVSFLCDLCRMEHKAENAYEQTSGVTNTVRRSMDAYMWADEHII